MEFVGRTVKKEFEGVGAFQGTVESFDPSTGLYQVVYGDGDSECLESAEMIKLLDGPVGSAVASDAACYSKLSKKPRVGRKPKKRRKVGPMPGKSSDEVVSEAVVWECRDGLNVEGSVPVSGINLNYGLESNDGTNAHQGSDMNDGSHLKGGFMSKVEYLGNAKWARSIDLNVDVSGDYDANAVVDNSGMESRKVKCCFDLNLGYDGETNNINDWYDDTLMRSSNSGIKAFESEFTELQAEGDDACKKLGGLCVNNAEGAPLKNMSTCGGHVAEDSFLGFLDGTGKEGSVLVCDLELDVNASFGSVDVNDSKDSNYYEIQVKEYFCEPETGHQNDIGRSYKNGSTGKKRRKDAESLKSMTEVALRRSKRRGSVLLCGASTTEPPMVNDLSSSPIVNAVVERNSSSSGCDGPADHSGLPPNVQLPPSSQNLNLDGIPILDVFSVYACLRSFSTLLFLSPFELDDFVATLKCKYPTSLFDSVHVSLLQTLRKHLEFISDEGSQSAIDCLRALDWNLLDLITWPVYMATYLLYQNYGLKCGLDLNSLNFFDFNYYKQPPSVKVEVLRCLCDDVIDVEAIRSELNRRIRAADPDLDFDRNVNEPGKKKKGFLDVSGGTCSMDVVVNETTDWNSDECCLCKMDGNLICCDGCPAAYHSKCVGVTSDLLPEGDWYCPECVIDKNKQIKPRNFLRGAELLGVDPLGHHYFSCCGYLLVSDLCNVKSSFHYYQSSDVKVVVEVLKSSNIQYSSILNAISEHWKIPVNLAGSANLYSQIHTCSETCAVKDETAGERTPDHISTITCNSSQLCIEGSKSANLLSVTHAMDMEKPYTSSEGSAEIAHIGTCFQNYPHYYSNPNQPEIQQRNLSSTSLDIKEARNVEIVVPSLVSSTKISKEDAFSLEQFATSYVNCYRFGLIASAVAEEMMHKSADKIKNESVASVEEIISAQLKIIVRKCNRFGWLTLEKINLDAWNEKCGWCFSCRVPDVESDCLVKMIKQVPIMEGSKNGVVGFQVKSDKKGHLVDVISHVLSIESRLHGLILGPWLNPHYTKIWSKNVINAPDISSLKHHLLTLESNLHRSALSDEWLKYVDSCTAMGSASHVIISTRSRKRGRYSDFESNPPSSAATGLGLFWWRGGRLSRRLFSWKVLPRCLASRAGRQAGCSKIPGILYSDSSDIAKRSKYVTWRAAVESSTSVEQLAFQVRDFDLNIRWDDIESTHILPILDKDSKKSIRSFKKAIIRRKCIDGSMKKYLIDFGKRRIIPDTVLRYGSLLKEESCKKKKYWLEESRVPLNLLKSFEERRIARQSAKLVAGEHGKNGRIMKPSKKRDFSYLFSRAQGSESYKCGHCKKDVLISEAVSCHYCNGFFHKRHVRKSAGSVTAECIYTCHKCLQVGQHLKINSRRGKVESQKSKRATTDSRSVQLKMKKKACVNRRLLASGKKGEVSACVPLRRSARNVKYVPVQKKTSGRRKKGKQLKSNQGNRIKSNLGALLQSNQGSHPKSNKRTRRKPRKGASWRKKRTQGCHTYWLNGLLLSGKPNDERVIQFKRKKLLDSSECSGAQPQCCLCGETRVTSRSILISCNICGGWFHGDAFGLNAENIDCLIGFKCHTCRKRDTPACPFLADMKVDMAQSDEVKNSGSSECAEEVSNPCPSPSKITERAALLC